MIGGPYSGGCGCMLQRHHYIHREACSLTASVIPANCFHPLVYQHPYTATALNPPALKNQHGGLWFQRIAASIDTSLLLVKQQLCSSSSSRGGDVGSGPSCMHASSPTHSSGCKETPFTACVFRCSQTLRTFPLSWEPRQDQHSAAHRHTTNVTPPPQNGG